MPQANHPVDKARQLQRALYRAAKRSATRRFHALYDKVYREDILWWAWGLVKADRGAAGVDGQTIQAIEEGGVGIFLHQLQEELRNGRYRPQPVRRVYIPKPDGRQRPLGIPALRDRVVQAVVKIVVEPIFEADFDRARKGGNSLFRPFALPKPYTSTKDVFCLREKRITNGYRKTSLSNHEIAVPNVPLREEVEVHLLPDTSRGALEIRIWWENKMVQSVTYPLKEFPTVQFSKIPNSGVSDGCVN